MSHEVETMAFANEVPWHGLGNRVEGNVSVDDMLRASGLDWEVKSLPLFAEVDGTRVAAGKHALVRTSDKKVLTVAGPQWKPLQNRDAMEFFREYTESGGATLETAGSLRGGRVIWGLARVAAGFTINGNDHVKAYILLVSPHEVGHAITVRTTSVRVVCANTLAMAGGVKGVGSEFRQTHVHSFKVDEARATVQLAKEQVELMKLDAEALASLKMSEYDSVRFLAKFFMPSEEKLEGELADAPDLGKLLVEKPELQSRDLSNVIWAMKRAPGAAPGSAWGILNGVTYWTDHIAGRTADQRLTSSWTGENAKRKVEIRDELLAMV